MTRPDPQPFDVCGPLPTGTAVLEASAGTGKTHTIAGLVTRFVAEGEAILPQLLVVTFTRAATAELRDRVRSRLVEAAEYLERIEHGWSAETSDEVLLLLADCDQKELKLRLGRLTRALGEFDAATVSTIHGFCQHVLHGVGIAGDVNGAVTLIEDQRDVIEAVVDDLFVQVFSRSDTAPTVSRRDLLAIARAVVSNPDAVVVPDHPDDPAAAARVDLAVRIQHEVDRRKRASSVLSYDDLLTRLRDTLKDPERGEAARARLRAQYRIALIDEFQDTDPIQWEILSLVFGDPTDPDTRLILIGDPKQAIYNFRGADVYAYLEAIGRARSQHTLQRNWRSDGPLLDAYNVLFDGALFGDELIAYREVEPAPAHVERRMLGATHDAPLRLRIVPRSANVRVDRDRVQADAARDYVARDVAAQIVELLSSDATVEDRVDGGLGQAKVEPRHLAVLVRTNAEATLVHRTLSSAGVPAVINGVGSVFSTAAATDWLRLLEALERPGQRTLAHAAALTCFLGWSAERIDSAPEEDWEHVHERLHAWAGVLRDRNVASLLQTITVQERLLERQLALPDGERRLTDMDHLGELLHAAAIQEELGSFALTGWLRERMAEAEVDVPPDEQARRLESDAEAVQVLTIHRSKGLEFPIVYVPFLWSGSYFDASIPIYHEEGDPRRHIDVGGGGQADFGARKQRAEREQRGEDLRVLYVALTRARHQTVTWWVPSASFSDVSSLGRLLYCRNAADRANTTATKLSLPSDQQALARLAGMVARADGTIAVEATPDTPVVPAWLHPAKADVDLDASRFVRPLDDTWRRTSYSRLTTPPEDVMVGSEHGETVKDDEPAAEDAVDGADDARAAQDEALRAHVLPLGALPAGREIGTFVHAILEHLDFATPDLDAELGTLIERELPRHRVELPDRALLIDGLRRVLETPMGPLVGDLRLRDLTRADRLDETRFELPLVGGDDPRADVSIAAIGDLLRAHLDPADPLAPYADRLGDPLFRRGVRGYLNGAIDLVLRVPVDGEQRYAVVDHKTNRLSAPGEELTAWHYQPHRMAAAMMDGHYPLQSLLYTAAVHRYLRWRLRGYDPDRHLAGVLYLFLRGMSGADVPRVDGQPCGVFAWRPPTALVIAISDLLDRGAVAA